MTNVVDFTGKHEERREGLSHVQNGCRWAGILVGEQPRRAALGSVGTIFKVDVVTGILTTVAESAVPTVPSPTQIWFRTVPVFSGARRREAEPSTRGRLQD
jgi:hypothetical protein